MRDRWAAFTLIELLAVIALMGLVATVGVSSIGATADRSAARTTMDRILALDGMCRLWARQDGAVVLRVDEHSREIQVQRDRDGSVLSRERVANEAHVRLGSENRTAVRFSALGTSDDYTVEVTSSGLTLRARVLGASGFAIRERAP